MRFFSYRRNTAIVVNVSEETRRFSTVDGDGFPVNRDFDGGLLKHQRHYTGWKLTMAIEYLSLKLFAVLLYRGSPHNFPLSDEILNELKRRRTVRSKDPVVCDKGYFSDDW